jgi:hypothetical protein
MGLTIHHFTEFRGTKTELLKKIQNLRRQFLDLPVERVGEIVEVKRTSLEFGYGKYKGERYESNALGFMMAWSHFDESNAEKEFGEIVLRIGGTMNQHKLSPAEKRRYIRLQNEANEICRRRHKRIAQSGNGLVLRVAVGEGCEDFTLMFGRLGNGRLWRGRGFTKTQYALHFVDAHLAVVRMLDLCKEAGILKSAHDEGQYFETRDLEVLAKNINLSTETIQAITRAMKGPAEAAGFKVKAAIEKSMNVMQVRKSKPRRNDLSD